MMYDLYIGKKLPVNSIRNPIIGSSNPQELPAVGTSQFHPVNHHKAKLSTP